MTELTRLKKRNKGRREEEYHGLERDWARLKDVDAETKGEKGRIFCKISDLILLISQLWQNQRVPHLPSFCHVIVISFPSVSKDPGTFQLSLIWQMSNNFAFNLHPAGAKYARQQIVVSEMVDCRWFWNLILTHPNSLSSLECQEKVGLRSCFPFCTPFCES